MKSGFFGFIPSKVRHHPELNANSKLVYAEITSCLNDEGVCTQKNVQLSKTLKISKGTISRCISALRNFGFIKVVIENEEGTNKFLKRYITPYHFGIGVADNNEVPHNLDCNGVNGVNDDLSTLKKDAPNQSEQTLLYNNNIEKVYTTVIKSDTKLVQGITPKQIDALKGIVDNFYKTQSKRFPEMIKAEWSEDKDIIYGSINTLYKLIRNDQFDYESVRDAVDWALNDVFWSKNLLSLRALRDKSQNGFTKFQNIYHRYNSK